MAKANRKGKKAGGIKGKLKGIATEVFGQPQSGFVAEKPEPKLETQKDGRLFAIDLLKRIERPARKGEFSAVETEECDDGTYTFPPFNPMLRKAFDAIYAASDEARRGFFVVMSQHIADSFVGRLVDGTLEQWERDGRMREMPAKPEGDPVNKLGAINPSAGGSNGE